MDKIDGTRFNFQRVETDYFEFKKVQTEEQLRITSTVQPKTETVKADLQKSGQQQLSSFQNTQNPNQEVANDSSALQRLLEFSTMNDSANAQTDLDMNEIVSSMKNQFQMQTFSGKEFEPLLNLLNQNPGNALMKNAITDVLRAFSAAQSANAAHQTMEKAIDDLINLLKNNETFQMQVRKQGNSDKNAGKPPANLLFDSVSILSRSNKYETSSQDMKELFHQIQSSVPEESSIYKTIDIILSAMKRVDEAQRFDLKSAVEKLLNIPGKLHPETTDKLTILLQKALGPGNTEEKNGTQNIAQSLQSGRLAQILFNKAQLSPEKHELENAISVINQLKKQYPQSHAVQMLSAQTLSGLTSNLLSNQPILHFLLKSFLNGSPHIADVWMEPDYEEGKEKGKEKTSKILLTIDLDGSNSFEVELKAIGKTLFAKILCPEPYVEDMQGLKKVIREQANGLGFSVPNLSVGILSDKRSLNEVFGKESGGRRSFHARV